MNRILAGVALLAISAAIPFLPAPEPVLAADCSHATHDVYNIPSGPLNVRSGPGTGYSIKDVEYSDYDVVRYDNGPILTNNGYNWVQVYYYKPSGGSYNGAYVGWVAYNYVAYATQARNTTGASQPVFTDAGLSSIARWAPNDAVAGNGCSGYEKANDGNVNAWRTDFYYNLPYVDNGYVNGFIWNARTG